MNLSPTAPLRFACGIDLHLYPALTAVLQDLDLSVRTDVAVDATGKAGFCVGWCEIPWPDTGGASIQASPAFRSLPELDAFCAEHQADYRALGSALQESGYPSPGEWFWQARTDARRAW